MSKKSQKERDVRRQRLSSLGRVYPLFLFLTFQLASFASPHFKINQQCLEAHKAIFDLRLDAAQKIIQSQKETDADNRAIQYIENLHDIIQVFISEDPKLYKEYGSRKAQRLKKISELPDNNPYKKFASAEIQFHWAITRAKFQDYYNSAFEVNNAYKLLKANQKAFPDFKPNYKTLGMIESYLSTVPSNYQWLAKLVGLEGNSSQGFKKLRKIALGDTKAEHAFIKKEAQYFLSFALYQLKKNEKEAWRVATLACADYKSSGLSTFFLASLGMKLKKNERALQILKAKPNGRLEGYENFQFLDYLLGLAKLNKLEKGADQWLLKYMNNFKGMTYKKDCAQKLSWYYLINNRSDLYKKYKNLIGSVGTNINEEDKQAQLFFSKPDPNPALLKSRLLYDGGYLQEALKLVRSIKASDFSTDIAKSEYCYRKGRIYEAIGEKEIAIRFYKASADFGIRSPEYYAANSCIQLGKMYSKSGNSVEAKKYFLKARTFKYNKEYVDSIERESKVGVKKLK